MKLNIAINLWKFLYLEFVRHSNITFWHCFSMFFLQFFIEFTMICSVLYFNWLLKILNKRLNLLSFHLFSLSTALNIVNCRQILCNRFLFALILLRLRSVQILGVISQPRQWKALQGQPDNNGLNYSRYKYKTYRQTGKSLHSHKRSFVRESFWARNEVQSRSY